MEKIDEEIEAWKKNIMEGVRAIKKKALNDGGMMVVKSLRVGMAKSGLDYVPKKWIDTVAKELNQEWVVVEETVKTQSMKKYHSYVKNILREH